MHFMMQKICKNQLLLVTELILIQKPKEKSAGNQGDSNFWVGLQNTLQDAV